MGKKEGQSSSKKKTSSSSSANKNSSNAEEQLIWVDPARVRFQHSRIRPYFSGCGRTVEGTLESIRRNEMKPSDLPPIQVIVGPETSNDDDGGSSSAGPWYFSLNNRRLWVLKRCREEGLLENNRVQVRVREPKSAAEAARYSLQNCALEARLMKEPPPSAAKRDVGSEATGKTQTRDNKPATSRATNDSVATRQSRSRDGDGDKDDASLSSSSSGSSSSESDTCARAASNRFSALF